MTKRKRTPKPKKVKRPFIQKELGLALLFLVALTFLSFYASLNNGFTNWDDETYVHKNELIYKLSAENTGKIFNPDYLVSANYHPLTILSLAINYHFGGMEPFGYHLVNLLLHILNVCLVFFLIYKMTGRQWLWAMVPAVIFAIHPMHVESVAWISARKDVLYGLFFLLGLVYYLKYVKEKKKVLLLISLVLFLFSCLSKAMAVVFPLVLLLVDFWENRKDYKLLVLEKIPFFAISLGFGLLAISSQKEGGAIGEEAVFTFIQRIMFASYGFIMYIAKFFVPVDLCTFYPYPSLNEAGNLPVIFYLSPFVVLLLAGLVLWSLRKTKLLVWGFGLYTVTLILVLQFLSVGQAVMAERYTYLPYIGLGFVLGGGINYLWNKLEKQQLKYALLGACLLVTTALAYLTFEQSKVWKNSETLWTRVIDLHEFQVSDSYKNRGNYLAANGRVTEALKDFEIALQIAPKDAGLVESLANTYASQGKLGEAIPYYNKAIEMNPEKASVYLNRGIALAQMKRFDESLKDLKKAEALGQNLMTILPNRAYVYLEAGLHQQSIADYNLLIQNRPKEASFYRNRGQAYFNAGNFNKAMEDFKISFAKNPKDGNSVFNIAVCLSRLGQKEEATKYARKAEALGMKVPAQFWNSVQ